MFTTNSNDISFSSFSNSLSDYTTTVEESGLSTTASSSIFNENEIVEIENEDGYDEEESGENFNFHDSKIRLSTISQRGVLETAQANDPSPQLAITSTNDAFSEEIKFISHNSLRNITKDVYDYVVVSSGGNDVIKRKKSKDFFRRNKSTHKSKGGNKKRKKKVKILRASWKDDESGKDIEVALKKVESLSVFDRNKSEMDKESLEVMESINLLYKLSHHQNLLRIFGYTVDPSTLNHFLIVQHANGGNLRKLLREHYAELTWNDKLRACTDLASGLKYIHDHDIIHLALHSNNVLHHNYKLVISDLGISKSNISTSSSILPYVDPRYLADVTNYQRNKQSDIYALGILMHEISGGRIPYDEYLMKSDVAIEIMSGCEKDISYLPELSPKIVHEGYRQQPMFGTPPEYVALYQQCWQADSTMRPSVDEVLTRLGAIGVGSKKTEKEKTVDEIEEKDKGEGNRWNVNKKEVNQEYNEKGVTRDLKRDIIYVQDAGVTSGTESSNGLSVYFSADATFYPTDSMVYSFADEELGKKKRRYFTKKKIFFAVFIFWMVVIVVVACVMIGVFVAS